MIKKGLTVLAAGLAALFLQTAVLSHLPIKPDLVLILVVGLGLSYEPFRGVLLAFLLGCLMDVFGGSTVGFFALSKTLVFLFVFAVRGHLFLEPYLAKAGLVLTAALIEAVLFLLFVRLALSLAISAPTMGQLIAGPVLLTTLIGPLCFHGLKGAGMLAWE
jgi:rod shape-determining protein MreD